MNKTQGLLVQYYTPTVHVGVRSREHRLMDNMRRDAWQGLLVQYYTTPTVHAGVRSREHRLMDKMRRGS